MRGSGLRRHQRNSALGIIWKRSALLFLFFSSFEPHLKIVPVSSICIVGKSAPQQSGVVQCQKTLSALCVRPSGHLCQPVSISAVCSHCPPNAVSG